MESQTYRLEILPEEVVTPESDAAIRELLCTCFPPDVPIFSESRCWHNCAPEFTLVYRENRAVLGHVGIVHRRITCGGVPVEIAGIQSLAVSPKLRGCGLAKQLMKESMAEAKQRGIPFGFLFCSPKLERFYASLDWQPTDVRITMLDENGLDTPLPDKNIAMVLSLTGEAFPAGDIHLQGRDW